MSTTESKTESGESSEFHLQQTELTASGVRDILARFGTWLLTAQFQKEGDNLARCVDSGLAQACEPLLATLDCTKKINSNRVGYMVSRIPGPNPVRFDNTTGPIYLIPIRVFEGNPTAAGKDLVPGWATYITQGVEVSPALDCLVVLGL